MAIIARALRDWKNYGVSRKKHPYLTAIYKYRFDFECRVCRGRRREICTGCDYEEHQYTNQELLAFFRSEWGRSIFDLADIDMAVIMERIGIAFRLDNIY